MNKRVAAVTGLIAIISAAFAIFWFYSDKEEFRSPPFAVRGQMDLNDWDDSIDGPIALKGEWELYWHALLTPDELSRGIAQPLYMTLPALWKGRIGTGSDTLLTPHGYATYRLHVQLRHAPRMLALRTKSVSTAYRLWVNGAPIGGLGRVGTSDSETTSQDVPSFYVFRNEGSTVEIVLQVANFDLNRGGLWEPIELGSPKSLQSRHERSLACDIMLFGSLLIMAVYHLGLFAQRRKDRSTLYFGVFCLIFASRTLVLREMFLYEMFPDVSWALCLRMQMIGAFLGLPALLLFLGELFPHEKSRFATGGFGILGTGFTGVALLTEPSFFTKWGPIYQAALLAVVAYMLAALLRAVWRRRNGSLLAAAGVAMFSISIVNEVLYVNGFIHTEGLSPIGMLVFVVLLAIVLSMKFSRALSAEERMTSKLAAKARKVRELNERLREMNRGLEAAVAERTLELRQSNEHLIRKHTELLKMDGARRQLLSNISHELRTPLTSIQGYAEALLDHIIVRPEEQRHYLRLMLNRMIGLNRLITDLFELSKLEAGRPELDMRSLPVGAFLERIRHKYEVDVRHNGLNFEWDAVSISELPPSACIILDPERVDQVIENLVANAIRYTQKGGRIALRFRIQAGNRVGEQVRELVIQVEDTGPGIADQDLPHLFERFYRGKSAAAGGSGLGLAIAKEIVTHHGGRIWAESALGQGSAFGFTLLLDEETDSFSIENFSFS